MNTSVHDPELASQRISLDIEETLRFFDAPPESIRHRGHATSLVGIFGEDLGVALLGRLLQSQGQDLITVSRGIHKPWPVTTGTLKGPRLDRWLISRDLGHPGRRRVFQTEIKSYSAHAFRGKPLSLDATPEQVAKYGQDRWRELWSNERGEFRYMEVGKVLMHMKPPNLRGSQNCKGMPEVKECEIEPLLCVWWVVHPAGATDPFFRHPIPQPYLPLEERVSRLDHVCIFSMSTYLRHCHKSGERKLELNLPVAAARLDWLERLLGRRGPLNV
jgi:hypothetical protein